MDTSRLIEIESAIREIQKPRTRFQLEAFVLRQHDTEEMQYKQVLLEIDAVLLALRTTELQCEKTRIEIEEARAKGTRIGELEAQMAELQLERMLVGLVGVRRELDDLIEIWEEFPVKYTYEQIEAAQPEYWTERLFRQASLQVMGQGSVDWAQLDAMRQAGILDGFVSKQIASEVAAVDSPKQEWAAPTVTQIYP